MTDKHLVFIDESGSAGSNLLDNQPVFAIVGIAVREKMVQPITDAIGELKNQFGVDSKLEIKGAELIRSKGNALMRQISELVLAEGLPIVAVVVERRFMITALLVDDFFDPVYNDRVGNEWTYPTPIKSRLANHFFNHLSNNTINLVGRALTSGNQNAIEQVISSVERDLDAFRILDGLDIVATIQGAKNHVESLSQVIQAITRRRSNLPIRTAKGTIKSPNVPAFFDLIMRVEFLYESIPNVDVELIFDSSSQFNQSFSDLVTAGITSGPTKLIFPDYIPLTFGFQSVKSFSIASSDSSPLLQLADFYATGIRRTFDLCLLQNQPDTLNAAGQFYLGFIANILLSDLYNFIISDRLTSRLWMTFQKYVQTE
jgi:hypothetical protein